MRFIIYSSPIIPSATSAKLFYYQGPGPRPTNDISIEFEITIEIWSAVVYNMLNQSQQNFVNVTPVTLPWHVQNFIVIGRERSKLEHFKFWVNFEFDRNIVCGMGAWASFMKPQHDLFWKFLEVTRYGLWFVWSLWNFTGDPATLLPRDM